MELMKKLTNWCENSTWQQGWRDRAIAAKEILGPYMPIDKIIDVGCGVKIVEEIIDCNEYVGYDKIGNPDIVLDINEVPVQSGDLLIGLGILEYIDVPKFFEMNVSRFGICLFSYVPSEIRTHPDVENNWINSYTSNEMSEMLEAEHIKKSGYDFFLKAVKAE